MPAHTQAHVQYAPPALTEAEWAHARWEDDGGPIYEAPPGPQVGHWLRIAAALTDRLPELADREDVLVTCEQTTRSGAPAAFYPALARLEIHTALFATRQPHTIDPSQPGNEDNYPVAWGAFTHEAAHAAHSRWTTPPEQRAVQPWTRRPSCWRNPAPNTPTSTAARATAASCAAPPTP
ncbi:hypothetical protein GCM10010289_36360 [Streptomyces violascens]|uniref:Uncharacterized protein n=1 Tax=Streptomyces violascens TaxID=67381 RepID=A0ABQ3QWR1_9ACTN|nr:hypothetical protein [Streptomyces violascens]GGU11772.1 hypothetical protein GCM10010289_36360 [Streptomyces violascens]GHI41687.1 hypothetical protein Sviol_60950 [Streptomyces violascens]